MSTASSPIAKILKIVESRKDLPDNPQFNKLRRAREEKDHVEFAIAMDDKILRLEMSWEFIADQTEEMLAKVIVNQMRGLQ